MNTFGNMRKKKYHNIHGEASVLLSVLLSDLPNFRHISARKNGVCHRQKTFNLSGVCVVVVTVVTTESDSVLFTDGVYIIM